MLAAIGFNLSSLYFQMGSFDAAAESAKRGLELPAPPVRSFAQALSQIPDRDAAGALDRAAARTREPSRFSRAQLDKAAEAQAGTNSATLWWNRTRPAGRGGGSAGIVRLRTATHDDGLHFSYESLAELRRARAIPRPPWIF